MSGTSWRVQRGRSWGHSTLAPVQKQIRGAATVRKRIQAPLPDGRGSESHGSESRTCFWTGSYWQITHAHRKERAKVSAAFLIGQRHFFQNSRPKRKRGNELGTIPRLRFGLQKTLGFRQNWRCPIKNRSTTDSKQILNSFLFFVHCHESRAGIRVPKLLDFLRHVSGVRWICDEGLFRVLLCFLNARCPHVS